MLFVIIALLSYQPISEQIDPFVGNWEGELTHEGDYAQAYTFMLDLRKVDGQYTGIALVKVNDIYAEMEISAEALTEQLLIVKDLSIKRSAIRDGMEWCFKTYQLLRSYEDGEVVLQGTWQGKTSFSDCIPGKVVLRRSRNRA